VTDRFGVNLVGTEDAPILIRAADGEVADMRRPDASQNIVDIADRFAPARGGTLAPPGRSCRRQLTAWKCTRNRAYRPRAIDDFDSAAVLLDRLLAQVDAGALEPAVGSEPLYDDEHGRVQTGHRGQAVLLLAQPT
jgi:hypothetical protein